jgi:hypothetical protein
MHCEFQQHFFRIGVLQEIRDHFYAKIAGGPNNLYHNFFLAEIINCHSLGLEQQVTLT